MLTSTRLSTRATFRTRHLGTGGTGLFGMRPTPAPRVAFKGWLTDATPDTPRRNGARRTTR
ncbi:hypothetical protein [Rubrivirga sp.]|uniref:hypothetical protein n=1 Tax=Rubrivirga sp. TaxID=1885344 RepID=UPI003C711298